MTSFVFPDPSEPCLLVAEIGSNHQGDADIAARCIEEAAKAGADMVKFQKRHLPSLFTSGGMSRPYPGRNSFGKTYGEHRARLELSTHTLGELKAFAESLGLVFFASVWDEQSLEDVLSLGVSLLKLPSADVTNLSLVRRAASAGPPLVLSTGMSTLAEIDAAVATARESQEHLLLLHCNSSYPCAPDEIGLPVMDLLARRYGLPVGYSGHETGIAPSLAAAALGARLIERHFTLDKSLPGSDHACSLTPAEFGHLARMVREVEAALRVREKRIFPGERRAAAKLRKNVVTVKTLPSGHTLTPEDVVLRCTESPEALTNPQDAIGRRLVRSVPAGQPLSPHDFLPEEGSQGPHSGRAR